jgi:Ca2+-binding EF-hand superfamily protein
MQRNRWLALLGAGALVLSSTLVTHARPDDAAFLGTYELEGKYNNNRLTKVTQLKVERAGASGLKVTRVAKYSANRWRNVPPFTWVGEGRVEGGALKVTFRLNRDGTPVAPVGIADVLTNPNGAAGAVTPPDGNELEATYTLTEEGRIVAESLTNKTKRAPENWWQTISTRGPRLSSPEPDVVATGRVKLGGPALPVKANGKYTVIVPTDGTLKLTVSSGTVSLLKPDGSPIATPGAAELVHEVPHKTPVLGAYTAVVTADGTLTATFTQDGRIDPRIRPWSVWTHFPPADGNANALFAPNGPLEKFDKALALTGRDSAVWWERGTDYRTSFGFERGHYMGSSSPHEKTAEKDWYADLDGDGVIATEDGPTAFKRYDTNSDGKADAAEVREQLVLGQIKALWTAYDKNGDGKVTAAEISAPFVTAHDKNSSGDIDPQEWDKALRTAFAPLLQERTEASFRATMSRDKNGDGKLDQTEFGTPGAVDFQDSSDIDDDKNSFFDRDNIAIVTTGASPQTYTGNKVVEEGGKVKLFKGLKKDKLVVELDRAQIGERKEGIADGDLDDSYSVGWWGHCNAWSMAAIIFRKPEGEFTVNGVALTVRDQKGILVEYGMGDTEDSSFYWQQFGGEEIPPNRYAAAFHRQMHRWLRVEQKGMMADMDLKDPNNQLNFQVWNYPLLGYVATMKEAAGDDPYVLEVSNKMEKGSYADEDGSSFGTVTYVLHFDASGGIKEGQGTKTDWTQKSGDARVFVRYLIHPFRFTSRGSSGNPNVSEERLKKLFGERLKYNRIEEVAPAPATGGLPGTPGQ